MAQIPDRQLENPALPLIEEVSGFGQCGRCGRTLKNPDYIALGFGKICAAKMGIAIPSKKAVKKDKPDQEQSLKGRRQS